MGGADDLISFCRQQFCEIGTVLAEHPGDQGYLGIAFSHAAAPHRAASYKRLRGKPPTWATQRRSAEAAFRSISANFQGDAPALDTRSTQSARCGPERRVVRAGRSLSQIRART